MRLVVGSGVGILGLILFFMGAQTPQVLDPGTSAAGQPRATFFFFGLMACLAGFFIILIDFGQRDDK